MAATNQQPAHGMRFIRLPTVARKTGYSGPSIYRHIKESNFPKPVKIGPRASAWIEEEVDAWMQKRIEASRQGQRDE